jgi:hypothetical protein
VTPSIEHETVDFEFASVDDAVRHYADDGSATIRSEYILILVER